MTPIFEYYPSSSGNTAVSLDPRMAVKAEFSRLIHADSLEDFSFQFLQIVDSSTIRESVSIQYQ